MWNVEQCAHVPVQRRHRRCLKLRHGDLPSLSEVLKISFTGLDSTFPAQRALARSQGWGRCWAGPAGLQRGVTRVPTLVPAGDGVCVGEKGTACGSLPVIVPASYWVTSSPRLPARTSVNFVLW